MLDMTVLSIYGHILSLNPKQGLLHNQILRENMCIISGFFHSMLQAKEQEFNAKFIYFYISVTLSFRNVRFWFWSLPLIYVIAHMHAFMNYFPFSFKRTVYKMNLS